MQHTTVNYNNTLHISPAQMRVLRNVSHCRPLRTAPCLADLIKHIIHFTHLHFTHTHLNVMGAHDSVAKSKTILSPVKILVVKVDSQLSSLARHHSFISTTH